MAKKKAKKKRRPIGPPSNLAGQTPQHPKPATLKQKKLMRLKEGYPLASGQTPKKPPGSAATPGALAASAIMKRASKKEQAYKKKKKP